MESDASRQQIAALAPAGAVWPVDVLHYAFFTLLFTVTAASFAKIANAGWWLAFDVAAAASLVLVERRFAAATLRRGASARLAHGIVVVPLVFTQVGMIIQGVRAVDYAPMLERWDRWLFLGTNPLEALEPWSHPLLTELMQWAYTSYLLLPVGIVLLLAWKASGAALSRSLFALVGVMYLSYAGYVLVPAAGPNIHSTLGPLEPVGIEVLLLYRFTDPLPGVWLTGPLRTWMFGVELTKKDCFPSGHVAVAVVCWVLARRVHRPLAPLFLVLAVGVGLSTVYLRYHYVVDVLAGVLLAWFAVTAWLKVHDLLWRPDASA
jgi:membrane-associated phospholipid phosphatase